MSRNDLSRRDMRRSIMALAIPSIAANITTPLLGLVDMAIVGHMGSEVFIAAIALGGTCFSIIYWAFAFLRMGTGGVAAQAVGAHDTKARDNVLFRAMAVAIALGIAIIVLRAPIRNVLLDFMHPDESTAALTAQYIDILIFGAPATLGLYVTNGWFIGLQNSRLTLWTSLTINVVNIVASLLLVYWADWGIAGVASGTLIAQWTGFAMALWLCRKFHPVIHRLKEIFSRPAMRRFFSINFDIFLRTLCLVAVTVWFTRAGAAQGDTILAVNALLMQLFILFSYMMDGFAYAGEALAGKYDGSGDKPALRLTIRMLFRVSALMALAFTVAYTLGGDVILSLLSDDEGVLAASADYRWWAVTIPFAGMGAFVWDGIMIGRTMTRLMLVSMAAAMLTFFTLWRLLMPIMGNHGLWLAFIAYLTVRGVAQSFLYRRAERRSRKS